MSNAIKELQAKLATQQAARAAEQASSQPETPPDLSPIEDCYKAIRLHQFVLASGVKISPVNGYYVPRSKEEYELLEYYADRPGLLERIKAPSSAKK